MEKNKMEKVIRTIRKDYLGILFVLPVILGLAIFTFLPVCRSLIDSFHDIDLWGNLSNFGLQNYKRIFTEDWLKFSTAMGATLKYTVISIPLTMVLSFSLALLLNRETRGIKLARVLCYVPVVIPTVVNGLLWRTMTDSQTSYLNLLFTACNLPTYSFFEENSTALKSFIFMGCFGVGSGMILWLSQLKNIPKTLYESADLEGAKVFQKLFAITIPMCTPTIFYTLITNIIGTLQIFDMAYIFWTGMNDKTLGFMVLWIHRTAFGDDPNLAYASALSWLLFLLIAALSAIVFKTSKWVYYGEDFN